MTVRSYRDLTVWKKGMALAAAVYQLTRKFPKHEEYRISGQMIRAATSVPANIAEGHGRGTRRDYAHFVSIAKGSLAELETFLLLAIDLDLAPRGELGPVLAQAEEVGRMLTALRASLTGSASPSLEPNP
ncbi:four helix bundle protein [Brevundimonas sp.]|uniref:four helix bundle protein n=1 Tax=Brevundimonas sp. TaxID=1871086 RepID=UPI002FCB1051